MENKREKTTKKTNTKKLLIQIFLIIILCLSVVVFCIWIINKNKEDKILVYNWNNLGISCLVDLKNNCELYNTKNLNVKIKKTGNIYSLYIADNIETRNITKIDKNILIDKDSLLLVIKNNSDEEIIFIYKNKIVDFYDKEKFIEFIDYNNKKIEFIIKNDDYINWYNINCETDYNKTIGNKIRIEYLGNGKFSTKEILENYTLQKFYQKEGFNSCNDYKDYKKYGSGNLLKISKLSEKGTKINESSKKIFEKEFSNSFLSSFKFEDKIIYINSLGDMSFDNTTIPKPNEYICEGCSTYNIYVVKINNAFAVMYTTESGELYSLKFYDENLKLLKPDNDSSIFDDKNGITVESFPQPFILDNKIYYLVGECQGTREDGSIGMVEKVYHYDTITNKITWLYNVDHNEGWTC